MSDTGVRGVFRTGSGGHITFTHPDPYIAECSQNLLAPGTTASDSVQRICDVYDIHDEEIYF